VVATGGRYRRSLAKPDGITYATAAGHFINAQG
jgi:hypothetical protein